jgi:hypothetical protein
LTAEVERLAAMNRDYRGRVIHLIFSEPDQLQNFSDAFRLKKEEDRDDA